MSLHRQHAALGPIGSATIRSSPHDSQTVQRDGDQWAGARVRVIAGSTGAAVSALAALPGAFITRRAAGEGPRLDPNEG